jgi:hypothetical protein
MENEMDGAMERYIRQGIKNWAVNQQPPDGGRAFLLFRAARKAVNQLESPRVIKPRFSPRGTALVGSLRMEQILEPMAQAQLAIALLRLSPLRNVS